MQIIIRNSTNDPIYQQIADQIKDQIQNGVLSPNEALPSIRTLAKDLKISVITTKRAYEELEKEGYVYTVAAKGCYVASQNLELIREGLLRQLEEHLQQAAALARRCGLTEEEVLSLYRTLQEE